MIGHHHHRPHDHCHAPGERDWGELGAQLELEGEVLSPYLDEAVSVLQELARSGPEVIRRIVDVGCGPGVATTALAAAFPDATLIALDRAPALLTHVRDRAHRLGVGHRVTTAPTDLEAGLGAVGPIDLAWAGMVLHHLADPASLLRELHGALSPGGLIAIAEFGPPTRTLPDDLGFGAPGFRRRHTEAMAVALEAHLPAGALHTDWSATLTTAGFEVAFHRTIVVDLPAPLTEPARRWVSQVFQRSAAIVHERLSADDHATLAILTDPTDPRSVMHRTDVEVHVGRSFYVARKPCSTVGFPIE
jgi:SAM-dependent methyltransferase